MDEASIQNEQSDDAWSDPVFDEPKAEPEADDIPPPRLSAPNLWVAEVLFDSRTI